MKYWLSITNGFGFGLGLNSEHGHIRNKLASLEAALVLKLCWVTASRVTGVECRATSVAKKYHKWPSKKWGGGGWWWWWSPSSSSLSSSLSSKQTTMMINDHLQRSEVGEDGEFLDRHRALLHTRSSSSSSSPSSSSSSSCQHHHRLHNHHDQKARCAQACAMWSIKGRVQRMLFAPFLHQPPHPHHHPPVIILSSSLWSSSSSL